MQGLKKSCFSSKRWSISLLVFGIYVLCKRSHTYTHKEEHISVIVMQQVDVLLEAREISFFFFFFQTDILVSMCAGKRPHPICRKLCNDAILSSEQFFYLQMKNKDVEASRSDKLIIKINTARSVMFVSAGMCKHKTSSKKKSVILWILCLIASVCWCMFSWVCVHFVWQTAGYLRASVKLNFVAKCHRRMQWEVSVTDAPTSRRPLCLWLN